MGNDKKLGGFWSFVFWCFGRFDGSDRATSATETDHPKRAFFALREPNSTTNSHKAQNSTFNVTFTKISTKRSVIRELEWSNFRTKKTP